MKSAFFWSAVVLCFFLPACGGSDESTSASNTSAVRTSSGDSVIDITEREIDEMIALYDAKAIGREKHTELQSRITDYGTFLLLASEEEIEKAHSFFTIPTKAAAPPEGARVVLRDSHLFFLGLFFQRDNVLIVNDAAYEIYLNGIPMRETRERFEKESGEFYSYYQEIWEKGFYLIILKNPPAYEESQTFREKVRRIDRELESLAEAPDQTWVDRAKGLIEEELPGSQIELTYESHIVSDRTKRPYIRISAPSVHQKNLGWSFYKWPKTAIDINKRNAGIRNTHNRFKEIIIGDLPQFQPAHRSYDLSRPNVKWAPDLIQIQREAEKIANNPFISRRKKYLLLVPLLSNILNKDKRTIAGSAAILLANAQQWRSADDSCSIRHPFGCGD